MADSVLLLLEFFDDSEVECGEIRGDYDLFFFYSVASCYMQRHLNRVYEYFESTIPVVPLYFPDRTDKTKIGTADQFRHRRNWARVGMVKWNRIFRLFLFSGILGQPREVHPKFRNDILFAQQTGTRNFRYFWSNGKRPWSRQPLPRVQSPSVPYRQECGLLPRPAASLTGSGIRQRLREETADLVSMASLSKGNALGTRLE